VLVKTAKVLRNALFIRVSVEEDPQLH